MSGRQRRPVGHHRSGRQAGADRHRELGRGLRHPDCALPDDVRASFGEMGARSVQLAKTAQEVLLSNDSGKASRLEVEDDAVDAEHRHLFTLLIDHKWQDGVCSAVDVALLGRYYERFADHAVEIGRRVVFEETGGLPTHKQLA